MSINFMGAKMTTMQFISMVIIIAMLLLCVMVIGFDEITGRPLDAIMQNILAFILGAASNIVGVHVGAQVSGETSSNTSGVISTAVTDVANATAQAVSNSVTANNQSNGSNPPTG